MEKINILVVEDQTMVRQNLCSNLVTEPFINAAYEAWDEPSFLQAINEHAVDVILMDMQLNGITGLELFKKLGSLGKKTYVVAFTGLAGKAVIINFLKAGVDGMVQKLDSHREMVTAIHNVWTHGSYFSKSVKKIIKENLHCWDEVPPVLLTPQEKELLEAAAEGRTTKQMTGQFKMSKESLTKLRGRIMEKAGVHNIAALLAFAYRNGILRGHD